MHKLAVCRVCLNENARLSADTELQDVYEKLTAIRTSDMRPLALCYICRGQLNAARRLTVRCLKAEEILTEMLNQLTYHDKEIPKLPLIDRSSLNQLCFTEMQHDSILSDDQIANLQIKEEIRIVDEQDIKMEEDNVPDLANNVFPEPENVLTDSEDDIPLNNIATKRKIRNGKKEPSGKNKAAPITKKPKRIPVQKKTAKDVKAVKAEAYKNKCADDNGDSNVKSVSDNVCNVCGKTFTCRSSLVAHESIHTGEKPYVCYICDKSFRLNSILKSHLRIHTSRRLFNCKICNKKFKQVQGLKAHSRIHNDRKPSTCNVCHKSFYSNNYLVNHMRTHTSEKPYTCDVCGKTYQSKIGLYQHAKLHTDFKPYVCNVCHTRFFWKYNLSLHMLTHTGEKPNVCDYCNKGFSRRGELIIHIRTHTGEKPFVCDYCNKGFSRRGELIIHIRTHTGQKPYVCDYCNRDFSQRGDIIYHIRTHTGERPHVCNVCNKSFILKRALITHARTHTG